RDAGIELSTVDDYPACGTERTRCTWLEAQELNILDRGECESVTGHAIRYCDEIVLADKMVGRAAKDGRESQQLRRFATGVVYVAERWCQLSPLATTRRARIRLVTVAGDTGAGAGYVDPRLARAAVERAVRSADTLGSIHQLSVDLKQDSDPPVFRDR